MILLKTAFSDIFQNDYSCKLIGHLQIFIYNIYSNIKADLILKKMYTYVFFSSFNFNLLKFKPSKKWNKIPGKQNGQILKF